jgi:hypothetical protein
MVSNQVFLTFWTAGISSYGDSRLRSTEKTGNWRTTQMSDNCVFYMAKIAALRAQREARRPLHNQLQELLLFVMKCEMQWDSTTPR